MSATTDLPKAPADASKAALDAAINQTVNGSDSAAASTSDDAAASNTNASSEANANEYRTVFQDPTNFNVKHPLYNSWTLWFDNPSQKGMASARGSKDSWGDDMNKVVDFDSVEEFWGLYQNVVPPSDLPQKANYYLFKQGIKPAWEDPANTNGGKWSIQLPRDKSRAVIDKLWLFTMLAAIGETLEAPSLTVFPHRAAAQRTSSLPVSSCRHVPTSTGSQSGQERRRIRRSLQPSCSTSESSSRSTCLVTTLTPRLVRV